jgi:hypothetical protein
MTLNWGLSGGNVAVPRHSHSAGDGADCCEELPSRSLLGHDRRLHYIRNDHGGFCRSFSRHWLHGRLGAAFCMSDGRARTLVLVAGHHCGRHGERTKSGGVLLGSHHPLADARYRTRGLDGRHRRFLALVAVPSFSLRDLRCSSRSTSGPKSLTSCYFGWRSFSPVHLAQRLGIFLTSQWMMAGLRSAARSPPQSSRRLLLFACLSFRSEPDGTLAHPRVRLDERLK